MFFFIDPFAEAKVRVCETEEAALSEAVKMNQEDENRPAYRLYKIELAVWCGEPFVTRVTFVGSLSRRFGTNKYSWQKESRI